MLQIENTAYCFNWLIEYMLHLFQDDFAVEIESCNFYNNDRAIEMGVVGGRGGSFFIFREFILKKMEFDLGQENRLRFQFRKVWALRFPHTHCF